MSEYPEVDFKELMKPVCEYWVLDGHEIRSYDAKEEIKAWGGYWVPEHKAWCLQTNKDEQAYKNLKMAGLTLQFRRNL